MFKGIEFVWTRVLKPVLDFLLDLLGEIVNFVTNVFSGIANVFDTAFSAIGKAVEKVTGFFDKFISTIKTAWDWLTKWNRTEAKDKNPKHGGSVDGSHRSGLTRVPFDGYVAELHKNEEVLTADDPRNRNNNKSSSKTTNFNPSITINIDNVRNDDDIKKISRELDKVLTQFNRTLGVV